MNNQVNLTDDELSLIQTALQLAEMSYDKYIQNNGETGLDDETQEAIKGMKDLHYRLNKEYFVSKKYSDRQQT
jgi:uncharacterized protein involved in exopolysaccharide biosynthesis